MFKTIEWTEQGVRMIDQTRLHAEDIDCCLRVVHDSHRLEVGVVGLGLRFGMVLFQRSGETRRLANLGGESFWDADKSRLAPEAGVGGILNRRGRLRRVGWQRVPDKKGESDGFISQISGNRIGIALGRWRSVCRACQPRGTVLRHCFPTVCMLDLSRFS